MSDLAAVAPLLAERPVRLVWVETPTNPLLNIADIAALAEVAHEAGALLVVDNTFASPYLQQPLDARRRRRGALDDQVPRRPLRRGRRRWSWPTRSWPSGSASSEATGGVPGPFDAWLTLRGIKTLAVRMDRHCDNAARVAADAGRAPGGGRGVLPGPARPSGARGRAGQMRGFGGMVSFRLLGGEEAAVRACGRTRLFTLAESLGGVESLIEHPARMTHASVAGSQLEVPADLIRLSVGIEDCDDLLDDLRQAL